MQFADVTAGEPYRAGRPYARALVELGGIRAVLAVPLLKDGVAVGMVAIYRQEAGAFSDKQIVLLQNFAGQAVIAMENARLITEQREALEQQTARAEVMEVINTSPGNLAPVFDAMLERATTLCCASFGILWDFNGEFARAGALHQVPAAYAELCRAPFRPSPGSGPASIMCGEDTFTIADLTEYAPYQEGDALTRALVDLAGARSVIIAPLRKDATTLGAITLYRRQVSPFTDKQITLLENFAAQAVIAMENARLLTEQREALEQQTATAEVLETINASPGDVLPVFEALVEKAMRLCEAAFGTLAVLDGNRFVPMVVRGVPAAYANYRMHNPLSIASNTMTGRILRGATVVHVRDAMAEDAYRDGDPDRRALVDLGGARSALLVGLRKDDVLLGVLQIYRQEVRPFNDRQIALLENFAAQAVIAMENARLLTEQREALEQQTATAEVLQVINASPGDLGPVFDAMLEKALRLCGAAFGTLYTFDDENFEPVAFRGVSPRFAELMTKYPPTRRPGSPAARALEAKRPIDVPNLMDEENYRSGLPAAIGLVEVGGVRAFTNVPLVKDGAVLGLFTIYRQQVAKLSDKQIALLENFAAQAVIAMENARLLTEQREALDRQTATAEVLQVINSSPGNLMPVFDAILEKAHRLCGADVGALGFYDGAMFRSVAMHGFPEAHAARARQPWVPTPHQDPLVRGERMVHVADLKAEGPEWDNDITRSANAGTAIRTGLWLPLRKDGVLQGYISSFRNSVRPFSDNEISLLENFAEQAVIAIENARLLNEIQQRQEELRITFENMGDGVAMFDEMQHLIAWNRKFQDILEVPDDIIARRQTFSEYVHYLAERGEYGADADVEEQVRRLLENAGQMRVFERERPNGRVIEVRNNPVAGGGFVLIYADITERKRNEAEIRAARDAAEEASRTIEAAYRDLKTAQANLIQAEKMASLGQLTAGIAHEIKNPLNFVNNFAALSVDLLGELKDAIAPAERALTERQRAEVEEVSAMLTSNLEKITEHGKRADGIVKAMLEHSRGSSAERRVVDLNALIDEAMNLAYHGARAQDQSFNITLERDFGDKIAPIEVNPQDITRVFLNIFSNGFYATTRRTRNAGDTEFEPTLKVTTRDAGEMVEIRVRDSGTGIPADIRDKLFQPFFTTKPTGEGTGLGLSITYDIVTKAHGGMIAVDSEVDEFTEFVVTLPRGMFSNEGSRA